MNRFISSFNRNLDFSSAVALLATSTAISILLGLIRTKLINANFINFSATAYFVSFQIPDLIYYTLTAGAYGVALMPFLADKLHRSERRQAWILVSSISNLLSLLMIFVCLLMILFPEQILYFLIPGASEELLELTAQMMRLIAINPLVFSVSAMLASLQQLQGRFFFTALAPIFYNISIILSIYLLKDSMGVIGIGVGVAAGALLNLLILSLGMYRLKIRHVWRINFKDKSFRKVIKAIPARSFDQGLIYLIPIIQTGIASKVALNSIPNFHIALLLYSAPINVLSLAFGRVAFPKFVKALAIDRQDLFRKDFLRILRTIIWIAIPMVLLIYFCRQYISRVIFSRDNLQIAIILGWFCIGIFARIVYAILCRYFYANKDTLTPLLITGVVFVVNITCSLILANMYGIVGLAMATSATSVLEIGLLVALIRKRDRQIFNRQFIKQLLVLVVLGGVTALIIYGLTSWLAFSRFDSGVVSTLKILVISGVTLLMYCLLSVVLGLREVKRLWGYCLSLKNKIVKIF